MVQVSRPGNTLQSLPSGLMHTYSFTPSQENCRFICSKQIRQVGKTSLWYFWLSPPCTCCWLWEGWYLAYFLLVLVYLAPVILPQETIRQIVNAGALNGRKLTIADMHLMFWFFIFQLQTPVFFLLVWCLLQLRQIGNKGPAVLGQQSVNRAN